MNFTTPKDIITTFAKKYNVIILNSKCEKSACKNPELNILIFSPLRMPAILNLYFSKKEKSLNPFNEIITLATIIAIVAILIFCMNYQF